MAQKRKSAAAKKAKRPAVPPEAKRGAGRPHHVIDAAFLKRLEFFAADGISQVWACRCLMISTDTFARKMKDDADFAAAWARGKQRLALKMSQAAPAVIAAWLKKAKRGEAAALEFFTRQVLNDDFPQQEEGGAQGPATVQVQFFLPENGRQRIIDIPAQGPAAPQGQADAAAQPRKLAEGA